MNFIDGEKISDSNKNEIIETNEDETPQETLDKMYQKINQSLANEVLLQKYAKWIYTNLRR